LNILFLHLFGRELMVNRGGVDLLDVGESALAVDGFTSPQLADLFIFEFFSNGYIFYNGLDQRGYKASWN
jgi:hypothetical protein